MGRLTVDILQARINSALAGNTRSIKSCVETFERLSGKKIRIALVGPWADTFHQLSAIPKSTYYDQKKKGLAILEHVQKKAIRIKSPVDKKTYEAIARIASPVLQKVSKTNRDDLLQLIALKYSRYPKPENVALSTHILKLAESCLVDWWRTEGKKQKRLEGKEATLSTQPVTKLLRHNGKTEEIEHQLGWKRTLRNRGSKKSTFHYSHKRLNGYKGIISNFSKSTPIAFVNSEMENFQRNGVVFFGKQITGGF